MTKRISTRIILLDLEINVQAFLSYIKIVININKKISNAST